MYRATLQVIVTAVMFPSIPITRILSSNIIKKICYNHFQRCFSQSSYELPINIHGIIIRKFRSRDTPSMNALIQSETWNTSVNDLALAVMIDPDGGAVAETRDGKIIGGSYACVLNDEESIGLFCIVKPELRKLGLGKILYDVMAHYVGNRNFTFTSVPKMVEIYKTVGQKNGDYLRRFVGKLKPSPVLNNDLKVVEFQKSLTDKVLEYESSICKPERLDITKKWLNLETNLSLVCLQGDQVCGYGVVCDSMAWPRVAPLLANNLDITQLILEKLSLNFVPSNYRGISFSFSEQHTDCLNMMAKLEMKEIRRFPFQYSHKDFHQHHPKIYSRLLWQYSGSSC